VRPHRTRPSKARRATPALCLLAAFVATAIVMSACTSSGGSGASTGPGGSGGSAPTEPRRLRVVATTPIVGEVVQAVAGDRAEVTVLMSRSDDPLSFTVSPADPRLVGADVVVAIDPASYEIGLADVLASGTAPTAATTDDGPLVLRAVDLLDARRLDGTPDPRIWLDPDRLTTFGREVAEALAERSGTDPAPWSAAAETYGAQLALADEQVQATLASLSPDGRRLLVTDDRLGHFADRYGLELILSPPELGATVLVIDVDHLGPPGSATGTTGGLLTSVASRIAAWG
jgi:manganese/zinc/iron transport system substrate-binding protein